jgi:hypothetical protein
VGAGEVDVRVHASDTGVRARCRWGIDGRARSQGRASRAAGVGGSAGGRERRGKRARRRGGRRGMQCGRLKKEKKKHIHGLHI